MVCCSLPVAWLPTVEFRCSFELLAALCEDEGCDIPVMLAADTGLLCEFVDADVIVPCA